VPADKVGNPVSGSFSAAGTDEVVGEIRCQDDGLGGLALLRRTDGVLRTVRVDSGTHYHETLHTCSALRTSEGRDLAICKSGSAWHGTIGQVMEAIDYARPEQSDHTALVVVVDDTQTACTGQTDLAMGSLEGFELIDLDHDGHNDVRIVVRARKIRVPPQPPCEAIGTMFIMPSVPLKLPQAPRIVLDFRARGATLVPTPATAQAVKKLNDLIPR
jgi:hypothetical protein